MQKVTDPINPLPIIGAILAGFFVLVIGGQLIGKLSTKGVPMNPPAPAVEKAPATPADAKAKPAPAAAPAAAPTAPAAAPAAPVTPPATPASPPAAEAPATTPAAPTAPTAPAAPAAPSAP